MKTLPVLRTGVEVLDALFTVWRNRLNALLERTLDTGIRLGDAPGAPQITYSSVDPRVFPGVPAALGSLIFQEGQANALYQKTGRQPTDWTPRTL